MDAFDWSRVTGSPWYRPEAAQAAADALGGSPSAEHAAREVARLRYEVSNDHEGTLDPAAVPATTVFLEVIADHPGQARMEALNALLDWWSRFVPDPGFENYDDPEHGPVNVCEGVEERVRAAADMLREVAMDHSDGGRHRPAVRELLRNLDDGWVAGDG
ncbi:hypothetical protein [Actinoallomurus sp. CA-142502]|uniref:hypothetical protein n=1 Tax=Actinoallomurus sp. CA-142502 TaxID=3239885 RepID=UPI003D921E18